MHQDPVPHKTQITFAIPFQGRFRSLKKSDISTEEVESASNEGLPLFLQRYCDDLAHKRFMPADVSAVAISL